MSEEMFGPVATIYVYEDQEWEQVLELVDQTSPYALTGAVFSKIDMRFSKHYQNCVIPQGIFI